MKFSQFFGWLLVALVALATPALTWAQPANSDAASPQGITGLSGYVTVVGGVLTGVATLLGLPIVRLNQRKTRAEIAKLELEAAALREKIPSEATKSRPGEGIRIHIERSSDTTVQVLADPRFLAPLLLLLDFVFAWALLTLAGYFLDVFGLDLLRQLALAVLAVILLLPIAKQAIHVRAVLRPDRSSEEIQASIRQAKATFYLIYFIFFVSSLVATVFLFSEGVGPPKHTEDVLAWGFVSWTTILLCAFPFARNGFGVYIEREFRSNAAPHAVEGLPQIEP